MNRKTTVAALAIGSLWLAHTGAEAANDPLVVWQGAATITSLNATCKQQTGLQVGGVLTSVFRPRLVGDEPASGLSLMTSRAAQLFIRTSGGDQMHGSGAYTGPVIRARATSVSGGQTGTYKLTITPAAITASTGVITIVGSITNFFVSGCTMKFKAAYQPRGN